MPLTDSCRCWLWKQCDAWLASVQSLLSISGVAVSPAYRRVKLVKQLEPVAVAAMRTACRSQQQQQQGQQPSSMTASLSGPTLQSLGLVTKYIPRGSSAGPYAKTTTATRAAVTPSTAHHGAHDVRRCLEAATGDSKGASMCLNCQEACVCMCLYVCVHVIERGRLGGL